MVRSRSEPVNPTRYTVATGGMRRGRARLGGHARRVTLTVTRGIRSATAGGGGILVASAEWTAASRTAETRAGQAGPAAAAERPGSRS